MTWEWIAIVAIFATQLWLTIKLSVVSWAIKENLRMTEELASAIVKSMEIHDVAERRISRLEHKVASEHPVDLPKYDESLKDLHGRLLEK